MPRAHFSDPKAEAEHAQHGLAGAVARYTVAIIPEAGLNLGSGVLVSHEGDLFVATARHVAQDLSLDNAYCIPKLKGSLKIISREQVRERLAEVEPSERCRLLVAERILSSQSPDVALFRLNQAHPTRTSTTLRSTVAL